MYKVTFAASGQVLPVEPGTTAMEAIRLAGRELNAPCGGNGSCGKCRIVANGQEVLACRHQINEDTVLELPPQAEIEVMTGGRYTHEASKTVRDSCLIAFDIGTTTVVCFLLSPAGEELAVHSILNPQTSFGADVITRIQYALKEGMDALTSRIRNAMMDLIRKCCVDAGITPEKIGVISVVGNSCMQQLFLGIEVSNLAAIPFAPVLTRMKWEDAAPIFPECSNAQILTVPDISGFVGADTVAGIIATGIPDTDQTVLMVDIGTNGEMVLSHKGRMIACSTAAGPALEGANIRFGMRGCKGAIDHVYHKDGKILCSVIGGGEAEGICGSGIIDAAAVLLDMGYMNERGRLQRRDEFDGQRAAHLADGVYLTQEDIRQLQMAKGAIGAGIALMMHKMGIGCDDIDKVILAGAFGSYMNPESACRIGLLPPELLPKIEAAGNIAGVGAKMLAADEALPDLSQKLTEKIEFLELASLPEFFHCFAEHMYFPKEGTEE